MEFNGQKVPDEALKDNPVQLTFKGNKYAEKKGGEYIPVREIPKRIEELKREMLDAAEALEFERAAKLRDQIQSLEQKALAVQAFARGVVPLLARGLVEPIVDRVFPVEQAAEAFDHLAAPGKFGKVLLEFPS